MADTHETIADIIAERRAFEFITSGMRGFKKINKEYKDYTDRLEAAHRREVATTKESLAVGNSGDCAKLREVVDAMMYEAFALCDSCVKPAAERGKLLAKWCNKLRAALAATGQEGGAK